MPNESFEHSVWNDDSADRIVLIVDLWHPDLTATETRLLEGMHRYVDSSARNLAQYWKANRDNARTGPDDRTVYFDFGDK